MPKYLHLSLYVSVDNRLGKEVQTCITAAVLLRQFRDLTHICIAVITTEVGEWLACWTQAQKGPGSNRSRDAVG